MNPLMRLLVIAALSGCSMASGQNFSGSDNFSSVVPGNWSTDTTSGGGSFVVSGGVLNFTDGGLATFGQTSSAQRDWNFSAGSYMADWQVQVDFTLGLSDQVASQATVWTMYVANNTDITDNVRLTFQQTYMMTTSRNVSGSFYTNDTAGASAQFSASASTVTLRASYLVATHQITLEYDSGSGFSMLTSAIIDGTGLGWGMGSTDTFGLRLGVSNTTNAGATNAILSGVYADNFSAMGAAIPEPSTYALLVGLVGLGAVGIRRRFRRQ